jgi:hypothetical protein
MVEARVVFGVTAAALFACSSQSGGASGASGSSCSHGVGCNPDRCVCVDGTSEDTSTSCIYGTCHTGGMSECTMRCSSHGGLASVAPAPNVASSPECDAFCNKIASLSCPSGQCDRYFWCLVPPGECEASVRANLACQAQNNTFMCTMDGWSSVGGSCSMQTNLCSGDGGGD